ncbi:BP1344/BB2830 family autotransporter [Pandoraea terrae]
MRVDSASTIVNAGTISVSGTVGSGLHRGAGMLGFNDGNQLTNTSTGIINTTGGFNDGMAINGNNGTLTNAGAITTNGTQAYGMAAEWGQSASPNADNNTFTNTGSVTTHGAAARAISVVGGHGTVNNSGTLLATGSGTAYTVYMQGNASLLNNSGHIEATGTGADAVVVNSLGTTFTATVNNMTGGEIVSRQRFGIRTTNGISTITNAGLVQSDAGTAIAMGTLGHNTLILQTGSRIVGSADGGNMTNSQLILQGTGVADSPFSNFGKLLAQGTDWTWAGSGTFNTVQVQNGRFNLTGTIGGTTSVAAGTELAGTGTLTGDLTNAGTVHPGAGNATGALTVVGNYVGQNGTLAIDSALGNDSAPVSPLVLSTGAASGNTTVSVRNLGGAGDLTTADGIPVVRAVNGATTAAGAFALGSRVSAGAYTYFLYRGGVSAGTADSWYLRSSVAAAPLAAFAASAAPGVPTIAPQAAPGTPPLPTPDPGDDPVPTYRVEVPIYSAMPVLARAVGIAQLGTFHERQGQQGLLDEQGRLPAAWGRVWGQASQLRATGTVTPQFDGTLGGVQVGHDLFASTNESGHRDHIGVLAGWTGAHGDITGFALGWHDTAAGSLGVDAYSAGLYWTHILPAGAYTDMVLMGTSMQFSPKSASGINTSTRGKSFTASLETGWPLAIAPNLSLEPQAQVIWQRQSINDFDDGISTVGFSNGNSGLARIGARLEANLDGPRGLLRPYLLVNLLHSFGAAGSVLFGGVTPITTGTSSTAAQFGVGMAGRVGKSASVYATVAYLTQLDATRQQTISGTIGLRWSW